MNKNDRIIRRVKGLLKLAKDNSNIEESQSAFMQAQQMMVKYSVDPKDLEIDATIKDVLTKSATEYKRLWWWERTLANIIAKNFRCTWYYQSKRFAGTVQMKRKIIYVGYETDVGLATEMYRLARSALQFYTSKFMQQFKNKRNNTLKNKAVNDYRQGFIAGLEAKFDTQIKEQQWGLVIAVPEDVLEKTKEITKGGKAISYYLPSLQSEEHYQQGYREGKAIDYTKRTIDK